MSASTNEVIQHIRRVVLMRDDGGLTDGQLMDLFINRQEEAALAALIRRHGPMVWGVCSRILRNNHDAEDAFQSTFLVFVRKATSVVPKEMIGNWLYGVARQTALNARASAMRRRKIEWQVPDLPEALQVNEWRDILPYLDQEVSRLADKYRAVIVLCDLEGKSHREAARQLGLPEGTLATHLTRARKILAKRLARHGGELSRGHWSRFYPRRWLRLVLLHPRSRPRLKPSHRLRLVKRLLAYYRPKSSLLPMEY
jgi:RNA polymerase sigma factor (sigma-70 family)